MGRQNAAARNAVEVNRSLATPAAASSDSAGGNLAIATMPKLRDDGVALPGAVFAFSPWLDREHVGKTRESNAATDALVSKAILQGLSGMFLGEKGSHTNPLANPLANPLKADYRGFLRLYVNAGKVEALLDNAQDLARVAKAAGVSVSRCVGAVPVCSRPSGKALISWPLRLRSRGTKVAQALRAIEQLTQRDRLDFVEVRFREGARQDAVADRSTQRQRAFGGPLGTAFDVGLEFEVPCRPPPGTRRVGALAGLLDLGPCRRTP